MLLSSQTTNCLLNLESRGREVQEDLGSKNKEDQIGNSQKSGDRRYPSCGLEPNWKKWSGRIKGLLGGEDKYTCGKR